MPRRCYQHCHHDRQNRPFVSLCVCDCGLYAFRGTATDKNSDPILVFSWHAILQRSQVLKIVQDGDALTFWSLSGDGDLGYVRTSRNNIGASRAAVLVLPKGQVSSGFSACISCPAAGPMSQTLVTNDSSGNLTILQQFTDTGFWQSEPFYYASAAQNVAIPSYNVTVRGFDLKGNVIHPGSTVFVQASACVNAMINGKRVTLTTEGSSWPLDDAGEISILIATQNISCQALSFSQLKDSSGLDLGLTPVTFDPSLKVIDAFHNAINAHDDLSTAKTQSGALLFDGPHKPSDDDLIKASGMFKDLHKASQMLREQTDLPVAPDNIIGEIWHYCKEKAFDVVDWGLNEIGKPHSFKPSYEVRDSSSLPVFKTTDIMQRAAGNSSAALQDKRSNLCLTLSRRSEKLLLG